MPSTTLKAGFLVTSAIAMVVLIMGCSDQNTPSILETDETTNRWYSGQQVLLGKQIYDANCIDCHNPKARGTFKWKQPLEDGSYPPPPLNGSAHAWHHPMPVLLQTINNGGIQMGGKMPPFKEVLNNDEKMAVVAYFQSFWNDEIYGRWMQKSQ